MRSARVKPKKQYNCTECDRKTVQLHPIFQRPVCKFCQKDFDYITKTRALQEYRLRETDLIRLRHAKVTNPRYKTAAPMQLYLLPQIEDLADDKWGSKEPYIVALQEINTQFLSWLLEDLDRLKQIGPEKFQFLVADRLEKSGLTVQLIGNANRKDGGIDLIAYPKASIFPFLLAAQVKHHRTTRNTVVSDVRDFHGAIASKTSPFHVGMIVTNTGFTPDAMWFAGNNRTLLRLRHLTDLKRWLKCDFCNESEWREIPKHIELAPGITINVSHPFAQ
jgi:Restriction endonuclease/XPA protein C-terminus